jgi:hypothetical protein
MDAGTKLEGGTELSPVAGAALGRTATRVGAAAVWTWGPPAVEIRLDKVAVEIMDGKEEIKKRKNEKEKRKRKRKEKNRRKRGNKKRKGKGTIDISPSYPHYTTRRSCFVKRFPKTDSAPPQNPLQQHSHSWSCHIRSRSPAAKRTLIMD